jgi:heptosyltransferase-2
MTESPSRILVFGPSWVGDMVMAQTLFKLLKRNYPDATIDVLAPAWSHALLARMPEVHDSLELPFQHGQFKPLARIKFGKSLREKNYDWAIVMPMTWKMALVAWAASIPKRTGFVGEMRYGLLNDIRKLDERNMPKMIDRYMALGLLDDERLPARFVYPKLTVDNDAQQQAFAELGLNPSKPIVALCPGAEYGPAKRWPPKYFADVADRLHGAGWQTWIFGSAKDKSLGDEIQNFMNTPSENLCGKTSMGQAIDLMAVSRLVITNDSGLMHVAAALDRPTFAIYGSSTAVYTPPLSDKAEVVSLNLECSPCFKRECPLGHTNCLNNLTPDLIWQQIGAKNLLAPQAGSKT